VSQGRDFDLFVIGGGSGGVRAARVAAGHGARVALAEEHQIGGTCVIRGCVPKKLLVYGAHFAEDLVDARRFGWFVNAPHFDWVTLRDNVLAEVARLNGIYTQTLSNHKVRILLGRAIVTGPHSVRLADETITADRILVATGAHPQIPDVPGSQYGWTSNEAFHLLGLPNRLVILGGGYIANEFAGIFNELGVKVTISNRSSQILRHYDEQIRDRLMQISLSKGIQFRFNETLTSIAQGTDGTLTLHFAGAESVDCDAVMFATGRIANTRALGLESANVLLDAAGAIKVDEDNRSSCPSIYAVGDVTNRLQLTPIAIREGQAFADSIFANKPTKVDYHRVPSAVFSHPPLAGVGLTEAQARDQLGGVKIYVSDFRPMKNVLANRDERALYKLVVDANNDVVVGVHMIGPDAPEILQMAAVAVRAGLTKSQFDACVAIHPTMAEELVLLK
jgi:glutathione reductase (NADPH)